MLRDHQVVRDAFFDDLSNTLHIDNFSAGI